jgi:chorismate mutase
MAVVRGIRGAVRADNNSRNAIFAATLELLQRIVEKNEIKSTSVASIFLTATPDLNAEFPAYAVREMGWTKVPLLCAQEIAVPGAMTRVIRVLLHVNTTKTQDEIMHLYLGDTAELRPDLTQTRNAADSTNGDHQVSDQATSLIEKYQQKPSKSARRKR